MRTGTIACAIAAILVLNAALYWSHPSAGIPADSGPVRGEPMQTAFEQMRTIAETITTRSHLDTRREVPADWDGWEAAVGKELLSCPLQPAEIKLLPNAAELRQYPFYEAVPQPSVDGATEIPQEFLVLHERHSLDPSSGAGGEAYVHALRRAGAPILIRLKYVAELKSIMKEWEKAENDEQRRAIRIKYYTRIGFMRID